MGGGCAQPPPMYCLLYVVPLSFQPHNIHFFPIIWTNCYKLKLFSPIMSIKR